MTNEEIIKELSGKTVLEINELVKALEEAWGVSAAAAVAVPRLTSHARLGRETRDSRRVVTRPAAPQEPRLQERPRPCPP